MTCGLVNFETLDVCTRCGAAFPADLYDGAGCRTAGAEVSALYGIAAPYGTPGSVPMIPNSVRTTKNELAKSIFAR